jgi:acetyl/propionyl-CoA carboxylase alpha subunit
MGEAAVTICRAASYVGAGTVEFLLDASGSFYFLEVNTRLQVEHPVTEFITGLDLVREQLRIAEGEKLSIRQEDIVLRGHAVEVRIQAEDVWNDFLPSLGTLTFVRHPGGAFVRNDSGMYAGMEVSGYYDSLLSKLVVWDLDRESAIRRMRRALEESRVVGVSTTIPFASFCMENSQFIAGNLSTAFVTEEWTNDTRDGLFERAQQGEARSFAAVQSKVDEARLRKKFVMA